MGPATAQGKTFDDYLVAMQPYTSKITGCQARYDHPYLGQEDLQQEAMTELWKVWDAFAARLPFVDVCRLGSKAMKERMISTWHHSRSWGEGAVVKVWLDTPPNGSPTGSLHDTMASDLPSPIDGLEVRSSFDSYCASITGMERMILQEFLSPSDQTVSIMEEIVQTCKSRRTLVSIRNESVARSLGLSSGAVGATWRRLQKLVTAFLSDSSHPSGYTRQESTCTDGGKRENDMSGNLVVDPSEIPGDTAPPADTKPSTAKPAAPKSGAAKPAAKAEAKPAAPKPPPEASAPKPAPAGKEKPAAPPKPPAPAKPKLPAVPVAFTPGVKLVYLGETKGTMKRGSEVIAGSKHKIVTIVQAVKCGAEVHLVPLSHLHMA